MSGHAWEGGVDRIDECLGVKLSVQPRYEAHMCVRGLIYVGVLRRIATSSLPFLLFPKHFTRGLEKEANVALSDVEACDANVEKIQSQ